MVHEKNRNRMSFLMVKQTDVRDSTSWPYLYIIVLLRFHIVTEQYYVFFIIFFISVFPYCFIDVIISCHGDSYWRFLGAEVCSALDHFVSFLLDDKWLIFSHSALAHIYVTIYFFKMKYVWLSYWYLRYLSTLLTKYLE